MAKEIRDLDLPEGCTAAPMETDILTWNCVVAGPKDSPYEGGKFELTLKFPPEYPLRPPEAVFKTRVYHPNVKDDGKVCIDILKDAWTPVLSHGKIILSVQMLLSDGNPASPLMPDIAEQYKNNRAAFNATAREWTVRYAGAAAAAPAAAAAGGGAGASS